MKTSKFIELLEDNREKELLFEYSENQFVPKAYHITEVKNLYFDSVDCGGKEHSEYQTIVQLWTNPIELKTRYMESGKALKILEKVNNIRPMKMETEIYFEYGNKNLPTSNYSVKKISIEEDKIVLKMYVEPTACKPIKLQNLKEAASACCGSNSKCC